VVIVAYRAVDKLVLCLDSITQHLPGAPIHIWDNSGPEFSGVRDYARLRPDIDWHVGGDNIGFAAAVNRLAQAAPEHDLLLVNPDAELLGPLSVTRAAIREPGVAVAAPMQTGVGVEVELPSRDRMPRWDRSSAPWDVAYRRMTLLNAFGNIIGLSHLLRGSRLSISYRSQPRDVDGYLAGCCMAVSREAWLQVGPFDEEFFMYQEEQEWQRRATNAGWRLRLADEVGLRHAAMGTVRHDPQRLTRSEDLAAANAGLVWKLGYAAIGVRRPGAAACATQTLNARECGTRFCAKQIYDR
jgi:GT2 family glycosyltransferase